MDNTIIYVLIETEWDSASVVVGVSLNKDILLKEKQELEERYLKSKFCIELWKNNKYQGIL